ncbi:MAG: hypothetical protein AMXMBFR23_09020 [Chloroflexota bacterium]
MQTENLLLGSLLGDASTRRGTERALGKPHIGHGERLLLVAQSQVRLDLCRIAHSRRHRDKESEVQERISPLESLAVP